MADACLFTSTFHVKMAVASSLKVTVWNHFWFYANETGGNWTQATLFPRCVKWNFNILATQPTRWNHIKVCNGCQMHMLSRIRTNMILCDFNMASYLLLFLFFFCKCLNRKYICSFKCCAALSDPNQFDQMWHFIFNLEILGSPAYIRKGKRAKRFDDRGPRCYQRTKREFVSLFFDLIV